MQRTGCGATICQHRRYELEVKNLRTGRRRSKSIQPSTAREGIGKMYRNARKLEIACKASIVERDCATSRGLVTTE